MNGHAAAAAASDRPLPLAVVRAPRINILTFSTLYPNAAEPAHGIFVETRLAHLVASGKVAARVVAPIPLAADLPFLPARYRGYAKAPVFEERRGFAVHHPRYLVVPKIGMSVAPLLLYRAAKRCIAAMLREGMAFDVIDAHYFYPDGIAAAMLGRHFGKPVVITARGTDIHLIADYRLPRAMIRWAAREAAGLVTVSSALREALIRLGVAGDRVRMLRNGVDLALFHPPEDRARLRAKLGFSGKMLASVGHLIPRKAHDLAISALPLMPEANLAVVGAGPLDGVLRDLARRLGVAERVRFLGTLPQAALGEIYGAADILVLASSREGWANVLLEAMACGTPVVASRVGGSPEVVAAPEAGELMDERTPESLAHAAAMLVARNPDRARVRAYAERFSWDATTAGQIELFQEILRSPRQPPSP